MAVEFGTSEVLSGEDPEESFKENSLGWNALVPPDPPEGPDQERLLRLQAQLNRIDQDTPYGSLTFSDDGSQASFELDPALQQEFEQRTGVRNQLLSNALQRTSQLPTEAFDPDIPQAGGEAGGALGPMDQSTQTQQAVFEQARNLLEPQFERQEGRLRQTLANQGLPTGSEAFSDEFGQFQDKRNRAYEDAAFRAVQAGNQRQNQLFQQGLAGMGAQAQARQQNLNEIQSILSGQQLGQNIEGQGQNLGSFYSPSNIDVLGAAGLEQQGDLAQYNAAQQQTSGNLSGLGSIVNTIFCSKDYKTNKRPASDILPRLKALKVEAWEYKEGFGDEQTHIGPYAEDFQRLFGLGDGKTIHPIDLFGALILGVQELTDRVEALEDA